MNIKFSTFLRNQTNGRRVNCAVFYAEPIIKNTCEAEKLAANLKLKAQARLNIDLAVIVYKDQGKMIYAGDKNLSSILAKERALPKPNKHFFI